MLPTYVTLKLMDVSALYVKLMKEHIIILPITLRTQCVPSNITIENINTQGQTCVFSNDPHSLEVTRCSPFTANDSNQILNE